jgi:hypothetical protein
MGATLQAMFSSAPHKSPPGLDFFSELIEFIVVSGDFFTILSVTFPELLAS